MTRHSFERAVRVVGIAILCAGCASLGFGGRRPAFAGTWVVNLAKSQLQVPPPDSTIFVISHDEPIVRIFRTHARDGRFDTVTTTLRTDSSQVDWELRDTKVTSRSWWEDDELVFWSAFSRGEQRASQVVRYSLSADGNTFTAVEDVDAGPASHLNRWIFDRREPDPEAQSHARESSASRYVVELARIIDVPCSMPGHGWSNLFFAGDSAAAERVAQFTDDAAASQVVIVERRAADGRRSYGVRTGANGTVTPIDVASTGTGVRCGTIELPVGHGDSLVRLQVAASETEPYVYGRVAEYRVGRFAFRRGQARLEVWPANRGLLTFDELASLDVFAHVGGGPLRRRTELDSAGSLRFGDAVAWGFVLDGQRFVIDSVTRGGARLHLRGGSETAVAERGFRMPPFAGRQLDGREYRLIQSPGRLTVVEFWSTECPFSERARPEATRLAAALALRGAAFISVARETDTAKVRQFLNEHPKGGLQLVQDSATWRAWNPKTITPLYYVIATDGTILVRESGARAVRLAAAGAGVPQREVTTGVR
ncbi:MAG: TlpA family protein disulfide reductase [Gemmatimonadaceae bacterium]